MFSKHSSPLALASGFLPSVTCSALTRYTGGEYCDKNLTPAIPVIASVMMHKANAELAIMNAGGVRDFMPAGPPTCKDTLKVQPLGICCRT